MSGTETRAALQRRNLFLPFVIRIDFVSLRWPRVEGVAFAWMVNFVCGWSTLLGGTVAMLHRRINSIVTTGLLTALLCLAPAAVRAAEISDGGKFFSAEVLATANQSIRVEHIGLFDQVNRCPCHVRLACRHGNRDAVMDFIGLF